MEDRREFLRRAGLATVAGWGLAGGNSGLAAVGRGAGRSSEMLRPDEVLNQETIRPRGQYYEATVPGTLDLAEHAKLSINVLTGDVDPQNFYGVHQSFKFINANPPSFEGSGVGLYAVDLTPRNVRTLPLLRAMSGSDYNLDVEYKMMSALMSQIASDGQMYYPPSPGSVTSGSSYPSRLGMMVFALWNWYGRDGNAMWLKSINLLAKGLRRDAIQVDDRAYYPLQSGIDADGVWHDWVAGGKSPTAYHTPDEPTADPEGVEGATKSDQDRALSALVYDYRLTGDQKSLQLAQKLAREILKPGMWLDTKAEGYPGNEHGIFGGHFHNNVHSLMALLDLAEAEKNNWLMDFAREGYDNAIRNGVVRTGWFPAWTLPEKYGRPAWLHSVTEICGVANVLELATRLTDDGRGDYWDDVDAIVRNQLIAQQIDNLDLMRKATGGGPENDDLLKRFVGGFGCGGLTSMGEQCSIAGCCSGNGSHALYYAWHGITRFDEGVAKVNLLLNRASAWMDIDSYLPYEGKVVLHNKQAHTALVRIPCWVDQGKVRSLVNDKAVHPARAGNYLLFAGLKPRDDIRLEFPLLESTETYTIGGRQHSIAFRGSTVTRITPSDTKSKDYPFYQREYLTASQAPVRKVRRFVPDRVIPLGTY